MEDAMPTVYNPSEADRVRRYTPRETLDEIDQQIERNIAYYSSQPDRVIEQRIEELKHEWTVTRYLQANAAGFGFLGAALGLIGKRKWAALTACCFGCLLSHGLRGWDPMIPALRRIGIRTRSEIDREIYALKAARGDFKNVSTEPREQAAFPTSDVMRAVNA
jgi:hypothetical protein